MAATEAPRALKLIRREWDNPRGCSDICREPDGSEWLRLCIRDQACQRSCVIHRLPDSRLTLRIEGKTPEVLFPYQHGVSLRQWLFDEQPSLGQRRNACLSLLAHCIEDKVPADILVPAAVTSNLRFSQKDAWLAYLPDWSSWVQELRTTDAVQSVAGLCLHILTDETNMFQRKLFPLEMTLIRKRYANKSYTGWEQLCRDLSALPEDYPSLRATGGSVIRTVNRTAQRFRKPVACLIVAALVLAALLSLGIFFWGRQIEKKSLFQGMTPIGDQELRQEWVMP